MIQDSHPVLSCDEARELETRLFGGREADEWNAMQRAGRAIGAAVLQDYDEVGAWPKAARVLVLAGKGHNAGDAFIAARCVLERQADARVEVLFAFGQRALRPLAARAWRELTHAAGDRVEVRPLTKEFAEGARYDLCFDGVFGFQFRPPVGAAVAALLERVNALPIGLRAAVDLPSAGLFRADFTYATGAVKRPALKGEAAGRVRYLDLGFFGEGAAGAWRVLRPAVLTPLRALRAARSDKRTYGHVFVLGGSRSYPGAVMLTVLAALRSGAGLVTAFVPETVVGAFAARVPEAIWIGWPEAPNGGLALEGEFLLQERIERATALVIGPGMGREPETLTLVKDVVAKSELPVVLDADALQSEIVQAAKCPLVLTPHTGEFERISGGNGLEDFAAESGAVVVLKGPVTRVCIGAGKRPSGTTMGRGQIARATGGRIVYHSFFGGPVLARGGSGDVLAGLIGGLLAQAPEDAEGAAVRGVVWHGLAADALARTRGQVAARTSELIEFLPAALRASFENEPPAAQAASLGTK